MNYNETLTNLLFSWRLCANMVEQHRRDAAAYARNPTFDYLKNSKRAAAEKTAKAGQIYSEFWRLVEAAGAVHVDAHGYLYTAA